MDTSRRLDVGITLLGLLGLTLFLAFYDRAFPSAAIDLDLSRAEILQRARFYLEAQGYDLEGYESALSFEEDRWGSIYLQSVLGVAETNQVVQAERLPIWYWHARWFRPLQKEEFSVYLSSDGRLVAFFHHLSEEAPGANVDQAQARAVSESYLKGNQGWDLADWEAVAASSEEKPGGRGDHHFEWRRRDFAVGASELHLAVNVQGEVVGGYNYWLRVPESFQRQYWQQRDRASFFEGLSYTIGFLGFGLAAFGAYLLAVWRGVIPWSAGLVPGIGVGLIGLLAGLNDLPLLNMGYVTTEDYTLFWLERLINLGLTAVYTVAVVVILWVGGQRLSKGVWPRQDKILPRGGDRWATLARSGWRGLMLGGLMGGYLVLFYLAATQLLGGWTPLDIPDTDLFATPLPFLAPLEMGLLPAVTEELMFRLVGISLVLTLMRRPQREQSFKGRRWVALLVPGALWGFAHLGYVRDPFYLRGVELTIAAVFLEGLFFLRFDLTTTIVAHFSYNAGLTALPLLRSSEPNFIAAGCVVILTMVAPIAPGAVRGLVRRWRGEKEEPSTPYITPATFGDLPDLAALPIDGLDWRALLDDPTTLVFCLRVDGEIEGVGAGRISTERVAEVLAVYVAPAYRRQYWGSRLVDGLCQHFQERQVKAAETTIDTGDRVAEAFWASQGWRPAVKVFRRSFVPHRPRRWRDRLVALKRKRQTMHDA